MDNKDFDNFNIDDDMDLLGSNPDDSNVRQEKPSVEPYEEPVVESYEDFAKRYADSNEDNSDVDLSSNDSEVFDLNSFSEDMEEDKPEEEKSKAKKKKTHKKHKIFNKTNVWMSILSVFLVFLITGCMVAGTFIVYVFAFVDGNMKEDLNNLELSYTTVIYVQDENGEWVEYQRLHGEENRIWVSYDLEKATAKDPDYKGIPQNLANAYVAIEDKRFLEHDGVDWKRTIAAFANMVIPISNSGFGGSTITQQLVKNITEDDDRKASRKVREIMRARYLEGNYSKETILECYMNTIAMGKGMCGVGVPAEYYFGKHVSELTLAECASLAAITKQPEYYRPDKNPENNLERRNDVLYEMFDQGLITEDEYNEAVAEELNVVGDSDALKENIEINNYFVDALIEEVIVTLMEVNGYKREEAVKDFYNGGYKIYSTMDPNIQESLEKVFTDPKFSITSKDGALLQGSMTILDYEGNIKGLVGGIGEKTSNRGLNRATMSVRQPGSTIKPLAAYAPAIEHDLITYSSIMEDKATVYYEGKEYEWTPTNWYDGYKGNMLMEYALRRSVNTIPVQLIDLLTPQRAFSFIIDSFKLKNLNPNADANYSSLGMGGTNGGMSTLESAAAFSVFGNKGLYYEPTTFVSIYNRYGELIASNDSVPSVALSEDTATIMNHLLRNVVTESDATGYTVNDHISNMPIFAKTGTSNSGEYANDIWFVGGTPYYVASCWCGYDSNQSITKAYEKTALKMWGEVMGEIHKDLPAKDFEESRYTQCRLYCKDTGQLATDACPIGGYGWYKTSGQSTCSEHEGTVISANTEEEVLEYLNPKPEPDVGGGENNETEEQPDSTE